MFSGLMASVDMCRRVQAFNSLANPLSPLSPLSPPTRFKRMPRENKHMHETTYRDETLLSADRDDRVVTTRPPGGWINKDMNRLVHNGGRRSLRKHNVEVDVPKNLLQGVECETTQFAFDEVWSVLHDSLQFHVPVPALPAWDEVQHVRALGGLPVLSALIAGERDGERGEEREVCGLVPHSEESGEEVDLAGHRGDRQEAGGSHDEEREYCFVRKT